MKQLHHSVIDGVIILVGFIMVTTLLLGDIIAPAEPIWRSFSRIGFFPLFFVILSTALVFGVMALSVARLLKVDLLDMRTNASPITPILYVLQITSDNIRDSYRAGLGLSVLCLVVMLLAVFFGGSFSGVYYALLCLAGGLIVSLHVTYFVAKGESLQHNFLTQQEPHIDVISGSLIGAQPRLPNKSNFYIGKNVRNHLCLYDEIASGDRDICITINTDHISTFTTFHTGVIVNGQIYQPNQPHELKRNAKVQIGATSILVKF